MKNFCNKKIGIWGYGVVGASARLYLKPFTQQISVFDQKPLCTETKTILEQAQVRIYEPTEVAPFLDEQEYIIVSPGVDLMPYQQYAHKFIAEFDIFCTAWHKPIIAITGTVGKTTITSILSQLLPAAQIPLATGGNIGTGMLDLIAQQEAAACALLELSSFQLDLCNTAAPDLAVITNIYPNHLDRHGSFENYSAAKYKIFSAQKEHQKALVPFELMHTLRTQFPHKQFHYFATEKPTEADLQLLAPTETSYYVDKQTIYRYNNREHQPLAHLSADHISYPSNWLIIYAMLDLLKVDLTIVADALPTLTIPDHRLACIAEHQGIKFYNDSKATVPEAMLAAVKKLDGLPVILFLGGVSKGVDRTATIAKLPRTIKHVICFGKEAATLAAACAQAHVSATAHATLEEAFAACMHAHAQPGDQLLFSPAGASFDLFSHYQQRGDVFKKLVQEYLQVCPKG